MTGAGKHCCTVTGAGPPLAASVPRARDVARLLGGAGRGSRIQPRVSLKSPPCQWAPSSEAPPPGAPPALLFMWPSSPLSLSSKETPSRHSGLEPHQRPPARPAGRRSWKLGGLWVDRPACRPPWNGSPRRARPHPETPEAGTWRIRVWGLYGSGGRGGSFRFRTGDLESLVPPPQNTRRQCVP